MAGRGPQTFKKRQKEQQRKDRQQEKAERRVQRKQESADRPQGSGPEMGEPLEIEPIELEIDLLNLR